MIVSVWGRGAVRRVRQAQMWLPVLGGPLPMIAGQSAAEPRASRTHQMSGEPVGAGYTGGWPAYAGHIRD